MRCGAIRRLFLEHPGSVGESYLEHAVQATGFAVRLIASGLACAIHAVVPGLCRTAGSDAIERLHGEMVAGRRDRARRASDAAAPAPLRPAKAGAAPDAPLRPAKVGAAPDAPLRPAKAGAAPDAPLRSADG